MQTTATTIEVASPSAGQTTLVLAAHMQMASHTGQIVAQLEQRNLAKGMRTTVLQVRSIIDQPL
jgi:hypothetical protein